MGNKWICVSRKTGTRFMKHKIRGRNLKSGTPNQGGGSVIPADLGGLWHQAAWSRASLKNSFISALRVSRS